MFYSNSSVRPMFGQVKLTQKVAEQMSESQIGQDFLHELSFFLDDDMETRPKAEFKALERFLLLGFGLHLRVEAMDDEPSKYQVRLEPIKKITPRVRSFLLGRSPFILDAKDVGVLGMMRFITASVLYEFAPKLLK